ncbi:MAG: hypothetical protein ACI4M3_06730 [Acutalibacteraceae bacterium]
MKVKFDGYGEKLLTFECTESVKAGDLVKIVGSETVGVCSSGDKFIGVCKTVRDGFASVQLSGYIELPYSDSITVGNAVLTADGSGGVKISESGTSYWVIAVDTVNKTAGILM